MRKLLEKLRPVWDRLRRMPKWMWGLVGVFALFLGTVIFAAYDGRRVHTPLALSEVKRPDDVKELAAFLARLEHIQQWQPTAASPERLTLVARFANRPENRGCSAFSELLRTTPGREPTLNDSLELLSRPATNGLLGKLRQDDPAAFAAALRRAVEPTVEADRESAYALFLDTEKSQKLIRRLEIATPAGEPGQLGRMWRATFDKSKTNRADWVDGLLTSGKAVTRLLDWYSLLERTTELPVSVDEHGAGLWFVRHREAGIEYDGFDSAFNGELQLRVTDAGGVRPIHTGVEMNGVRLERPAAGPVAANAPVRPREWPSPTIAPDQLARALTRLGLPDGYSYSNVRCNTEQGKYAVTFTATSRELDDCRFDGKWVIDGRTADEVRQSVRGLPETARTQFEQGLAKAVRFGEWPAQFTQEKADCWKAKVPVGVDDVSFSVRVNEQCRLRWHGVSAAADATAVAKLVAGSDTRLAPLAPLVAIERADMTETVMTGTLRVKSPRADKQPLTGVRWTVHPNGSARVELPPEAKAFLDASHKELPAPTTARPITPAEAREAVLAAVKSDYPLLVGSVSVTDVSVVEGVPWPRVSMTVGDWPALDLGSYPVAARPDGRTALTKALAQPNVSAEATRRWSEQHPRLGRVKVTFKGFDPGLGKVSLTVSTALALTDKSLSWPEEWKVSVGVWATDATDEWVNRFLEPQLATLEGWVNTALEQAAATTCRMRLRVKRDAFGFGRWLKLAPLAIQLDGTLDLVHVPLSAKVEGVQIDSDGLHWPSEMVGVVRVTIPAGPVALSDPQIRAILPSNAPARLLKGDFAALGDITYTIGCKITPPSIGGKDVTGDQLRLDNPWLHFAYVQAEVGGRLNNPKLSARGELCVLRQQVAKASFETSLTHLDVNAEVTTLGSNGWLPQFNGKLTMTKEVPVRVGAEMSVYGIHGKGHLQYTTDDPPRIEGEMRGDVLGFGLLLLQAKSDVKFENPELIGYAPVPFMPEWEFKATVNRRGITLEMVKKTPQGELRVQFEFPDAAAIDVEKIKARLQEIEQAATPASAEELAWLTQAEQPPPADKHTSDKQSSSDPAAGAPKPVAPPPPLKEPEPEPEPEGDPAATPPDPSKPSNPFNPMGRADSPKKPVLVPIPESGLDIELKDDWFRIFTKADGKTIVKLKNADAEITDHRGTYLFVGWYVGSKRVDLLATDVNGKWVKHIRCSDSTTVETVTDWTDRVSGMNLFGTDGPTTGDRVEWFARLYTVYDYTVKVWGEFDPTPPKATDGGYSYRFKTPELKTPTDEMFAWVRDGRLYRMRFQSTYVPEAEQTSALRKMVARTSGEGSQVLIAADPSADKLAVLQFQKDKTVLRPDLLGQPDLSIEMKLTTEPNFPRLGQVGRRLVLPSWKAGKPLPAGTCHVAGGGGCLVADGQFWLVPRAECTDAGSEQPVVRLDRETFNKWDSETKRHLPKGWQDSAARAQVPSDQVAAQVVAGWAKQRRAEEWGAVPMGLFLRLAEQPADPRPPSK